MGNDQQQQQQQQQAEVNASRQLESLEGTMVQISIPIEESNSSLVITEPQQKSVEEELEMTLDRNTPLDFITEEMKMAQSHEEYWESEKATASPQNFQPLVSLEDIKMTEEIISRRIITMEGCDTVMFSTKMEMPVVERQSFKQPALHMYMADMEEARHRRPRYKEDLSDGEVQGSSLKSDMVASEIQASGLADRIQAHGNYTDINLLKDTYFSLKGDNSAYSNFPTRQKEKTFVFLNFSQESPLGNSVLHIAARYDNDKWVEQVAQHVPRLLTAQNTNGDTALHVAAKAGHVSFIKKLLVAHLPNLTLPHAKYLEEALNEILTKNKQGNTFIHEALFNHHKGVLNFLVSEEELTEASGGFIELVARSALYRTNKEKKSVLYMAIEAGYKEFVDQALANLDSLGPALDKLIENFPELDELIPRGSDVPDGKSPLLAAIMKRDRDILAIIITRKQEWIHLRDMEGRIPLHYAASIGYLEGVQYLLEVCPTCAIERDKNGFFALHLASYGGHVEVVKKLLEREHCPDPREILDNRGRNILHVAVESGKFDVVSYILQAANEELGKMINDKDANGNTPLHLATLCCHPKIVHALTWDKRVDLTLVKEQNQTAFDTCKQFSLENPSLRQRLTRIALKSATDGGRSGGPYPSSIKVPPQSTESVWKQEAPNMDQYKDRINTLIVVSTLIITVTFAAGFTMPGGTNSSDPEQGMALMLNHTWFKLFVFCITISMYGAISVTIILIWAQLGDITLALFALKMARPLLGVTLATLSLAFLAGVHLVISDLSWLATTSLVMGMIFILMLLFLYVLLWFPSSSSIRVVRYISYYPFLLLASLVEADESGGT